MFTNIQTSVLFLCVFSTKVPTKYKMYNLFPCPSTFLSSLSFAGQIEEYKKLSMKSKKPLHFLIKTQ